MKRSLLKTGFRAVIVLFVLAYIAAAILFSQREQQPLKTVNSPANPLTIAIFGASGTAGDGILKAALASPDVANIHVLTRRSTARIEEGVSSGKVQMTQHIDYLDYSQIIEQLAEVDTVYWAIGISSLGADEKTYGMIHVDFPMRFVTAWNEVRTKPNSSFHFISSSDISEDSSAMWAREKVRAEKSLFALAEGSDLRVIAYRPDYIGPTKEEANIGQNMLYWFFKPVGAAIRAKQIGQAMIEATIRGGNQFENGTRLSTWKIAAYSDAYEQRQGKKTTR